MNWLTISPNRRRTSMDYLRVTNIQNTRWHKAGVRIAKKAPVSFPSADLPTSVLHSVWPGSLVPRVVTDGIISRFLETHFINHKWLEMYFKCLVGIPCDQMPFENNSSKMGLWYFFPLSQKIFLLHLFIWAGLGMQECHLEGRDQRITWRDLEIKSLTPLCGSGNWVQVMSTGSKYLYRLSHFTRP